MVAFEELRGNPRFQSCLKIFHFLLCLAGTAGLVVAIFLDEAWTVGTIEAPLYALEGGFDFRLKALKITGVIGDYNAAAGLPLVSTYVSQQNLSSYATAPTSYRTMIDNCEEGGRWTEATGYVAVAFAACALFCSFQHLRGRSRVAIHSASSAERGMPSCAQSCWCNPNQRFYGHKTNVMRAALIACLVSLVPFLIWQLKCNSNSDYAYFTATYSASGAGLPFDGKEPLYESRTMGTGHVYTLIASICFLVCAVCSACCSRADDSADLASVASAQTFENV